MSAWKERGGLYYKDLFKVWQHPAFQWPETSVSFLNIKLELQSQNRSFVSKDALLSLCDSHSLPWVQTLLEVDPYNAFSVIDGLLSLIGLIKNIAVNQKEKNVSLLEELLLLQPF